MAGRTAIYARISDDREGEERGVARQVEDCRAKASTLGLEVIEPPFVDNDISASTRSTKKRPAYDDMLERARHGEFGTIIAYSNSRLTRRPLELEALIQLHEQHRTVIRTVVSGDDDLSVADGRMTARIKASVDAAEAERTAERVKRAVDQRKKLGEYHGSSPPYGYRLVPREKRAEVGADLVQDPDEVALIREAVTRLLDANDTPYAITRDWSAEGKRSRTGKPWRQTTLRHVLTNPALIARTRAIVTDNARRAPRTAQGYPARWEAILDEDTYTAVCERLVDPARSRPNPTGKKSSKYALAGGLTVCGHCGMALYSQRRDDQPVKLLCKTSVNGPHPNHPVDPKTGYSTGRVTIDYTALEKYIFERFVERLNDNAYWQAHRRDADPEANTKIAEAQKSREAEEAKIRRAEGQAFDGLIDPEHLRDMIDAARERIRDIDREIAALKGKPTQRDAVLSQGSPEWILSQWDKFPPSAKRTLLKFLISKVIVNDWPTDLPTTASVRSGESLHEFELRRDALKEEGLRRRVVIEWRE